GRRARGRLRVPSSKSLTHRYFNLALLSGAPVVVERPLFAEDTRLFLAALGRCGFRVEEGDDDVRLTPDERSAGEGEVFCGDAGQSLSAILMAALRAPEPVVVEVPALTSRPYVDVTLAAATAFDGHIERAGPHAYRVRPSALRGGRLRVEGDFSAACYPAAAA